MKEYKITEDDLNEIIKLSQDSVKETLFKFAKDKKIFCLGDEKNEKIIIMTEDVFNKLKND